MATGTKRQKATGTTHLLVLVPSGWGVATGFNQTFFQRTSAIWVFGLSAQKRQSLTFAPLDIFAVAFGEVGRVVDIVGVGHIPPERLEILLEFGALEHAATVGIG